MSDSSSGVGSVNRPSVLVEMAMGYARSRVLAAAARLGIADALADGQRSVDELATACGADRGALHRLLRALASFGVVSETSPGTFVLTDMGAPLRKAAPDSAWAAIVFWADLLADHWSYLTECVRTGTAAAAVMQREGIVSRWARDPEAPAVFRAVMGTAPAEDYLPLVRAWDFSDRHVVADLGGGGGSLILAVLNTYPAIQGMLVDRQESVDRAAARFLASDLASRCALVAADLCQAVPAGADTYLLKHVLHGYSDDVALGLLRNCRSVMPADGRLLVIEFVLPDMLTAADTDIERRVMSDLNMLAVTGGKERSAGEWKELLRQSGFELRRIIAVSGDPASIIEAVPQG